MSTSTTVVAQTHMEQAGFVGAQGAQRTADRSLLCLR